MLWFWNIFSVFSIDQCYKTNYCNKWQVIFSILLIISSLYNIFYAHKTVCDVEGACDSSLSTMVKGLFMKTVAVSSLISKAVVFVKNKTHLIMFNKNLEKFHVLKPMTSIETLQLKTILYRLAICCVLLTVPVNIFRLSQLIFVKSTHTVVSFTSMYVQNLCMYCVETHFVAMCFVLYQKLVGINSSLMALKIDTSARNKYPFTLPTGKQYGKHNEARSVDCDTEVLQSLADGQPMIKFLEPLKFQHRIIREAVDNLNGLFGVHLGLSICSLCLYAMFDLYFYIMNINPEKYQILIYAWILQYAVRFGTITILGNLVTQQVLQSKILIMDINNRFLDNNTKEEIQLFHNQLCNCVIEFTACDFFTINTHLITSAIATGTTYLVLLFQFK